MSKRKLSAATKEVCKDAKQSRNWSLGLIDSMKDPKLIINDTSTAVVIKDKYPKSKVHYLILPHDNISSIYKLDKQHVKLLEEFEYLLNELKNIHKDYVLRAGFHAVPSMQRLHMHVISKDMTSECLKTKVHWNSFNTTFFIPYEDLLKELKETGSVKKMSPEEHKALMATPIQCNQCSFKPKNMPQLKEHLLIHIK